jgi:hypothetical protein
MPFAIVGGTSFVSSPNSMLAFSPDRQAAGSFPSDILPPTS